MAIRPILAGIFFSSLLGNIAADIPSSPIEKSFQPKYALNLP
jgi:hypothetical protein